ncbi:MAG: Deoxyguanosinetriphosphate triphosphohydrolase-like protein [Armatimonadetes bacterium]|nr:Deoxyguanosinetriphosphate triphosphohydrolase-like protein [Armatimonadota bacterium]
MRTLADYLERERRELAPYAVQAAHTRGRRYPEAEHPLRSAFERDRDRVIHCSAFRKLEYKTQVFVNHEGDYYRTRLTHTLEATQITRTLARFLRLNEDLAEAIALVHDVGHPPFGHAGDEALQQLMSDPGGFEHNLQGLLVVDALESPYPDFPGLNLTWDVREGIAKHSKRFDPAAPSPAFAEFADAPWPSLEAQLADVCDEIAYNAHDLDDGLTAGLLTPADLDAIPLWKELCAEQTREALTPKQVKYLGVRALINAQVQDVAHTVEARIHEWGLDSPAAVRSAPGRTASLSEAMAPLNQELRTLLVDRVYRNYRVFRMSVKARRIVTDLFTSYVEFPQQLPPGVLKADLGPHRSVCNYLAGMTDREALEEHRRLFDPREST